MKGIYHRVEQAILFDYFGILRPAVLRDVDIKGDSAGQRGPVRLVADADGASSSLALQNAVARIALSSAQGRLPQWALVHLSGGVQFGRLGWLRDPQPVSLAPQFLFEINWADSGPGFSWPEAYHCTFLPGFDGSVVTASADSTDAYGYTDIAIGWFVATVDWRTGCKRVITDWWRQRLEYDGEAWEYLFNAGAVPEEEAYKWREEIWTAAEKEDA
jgi:hypothetical protein